MLNSALVHGTQFAVCDYFFISIQICIHHVWLHSTLLSASHWTNEHIQESLQIMVFE